MKATRGAAAALAIVLLIGGTLLARRDRSVERERETETSAVGAASESAAEVAPADAPASSSTAGEARPDPCPAGRTLNMEVIDTIEREGRVALDPALARSLLLASQDPEHLAVAALVGRDPADRVADIVRAMAAGRQNPAVVWTAVQICDGAGANATCPAKDWEAALLELDGQNSEVWIHVAEARWQRGDIAAALEATQRAAAAAETRT